MRKATYSLLGVLSLSITGSIGCEDASVTGGADETADTAAGMASETKHSFVRDPEQTAVEKCDTGTFMREVDVPGFGKIARLSDWLAGKCLDTMSHGVRLGERTYHFEQPPAPLDCGSQQLFAGWVTPGMSPQDVVHLPEDSIVYRLTMTDHRQRDPSCEPAPAEIVLEEEVLSSAAVDDPSDPRRMTTIWFKSDLQL